MAGSPAGATSKDVLRILGASRLVRRGRAPAVELRTAVRSGLPFSAFEAVLRELDIPQRELTAALGIPERTIARRKEEQHLTAAESDRLYRVARTVVHAASVLGGMAKARGWLQRPNRALGGEFPLALLDTDIGARQVEDVLLRLAHGIHG